MALSYTRLEKSLTDEFTDELERNIPALIDSQSKGALFSVVTEYKKHVGLLKADMTEKAREHWDEIQSRLNGKPVFLTLVRDRSELFALDKSGASFFTNGTKNSSSPPTRAYISDVFLSETPKTAASTHYGLLKKFNEFYDKQCAELNAQQNVLSN